MKQAFIHIGAPGAGTERIQALLQDHEKFLRQHGCICPRAGRSRPAAANHHNLGLELLGDRRFHPEAGGVGALRDELARRAAAKIVISSNIFISLGSRPGLIESLRQPFIGQDYQISWIVYLRPYAEWLESVYIERVRSRQTSAGFDEWHAENRNHQIAAPARMLRPFFATGDRVIVRSHSLGADCLAADFLDQIGVPHPEDLADANPARQVLQMELTRLINEFSDLHRDDEGRARLLAKWRRIFLRVRRIESSPETPPHDWRRKRAIPTSRCWRSPVCRSPMRSFSRRGKRMGNRISIPSNGLRKHSPHFTR